MTRTSPKTLQVSDWGVLEYGEALRLQEAMVAERIGGNVPDRLVTVVHPPVVTLGRSGGLEDLRVSAESLLQKGIGLYHVDRGGMATFHGPGQLVAYPILKLHRKDLHLYIKTLIDAVTALLRMYGLNPEIKEGKPGVWVGSAKIASFGIAVRKWVTYHGLALNVNMDPRWFEWIVPCGRTDEKITSMERELGRTLSLAEVRDAFVDIFCNFFDVTPEFRMNRSPVGRPDWLIRPSPSFEAVHHMEERLRRLRLATVCQSACCPNLGECFERGIATLMILGPNCTRKCRFCAVDKGVPYAVDTEEPERVALAADLLNLKHVVVTSVTRDDLPDGGAGQFSRTIQKIRNGSNGKQVEVLIPDFGGSLAALEKVCDARPDVLNHNLETVSRLYPKIRPGAKYRCSLGILEYAARLGLPVKSGIMLGLGETDHEISEALEDLRRAGCQYLTMGQYLAPSKNHVPVDRYVSPEAFSGWADTARAMGFKAVAAGPLIRSSYRADEMLGKE